MAPMTVVVTGANKGIGLEIARQLAQRGGTRTVLASRSEERGRAALEQVKKDAAAGNGVLFHQLDITDHSSITQFADWARADLRQIDILINNAGFAYKGNTFGSTEAAETLKINFHGTAGVCDALKDLITDGGRIINIGSTSGKLSIIPDPALRAKFESASSKEELVQLTDSFVDAIKRDRLEGWPRSMYGISKLAENIYSRVLAKELEPRRIFVAAVCPGYCATDMSSWRGTKTAAEGADTPVWLATLPESQLQSKTGRFFRDRKEEPF